MEDSGHIIKLFRQLGGTFENTELKYSKDSGFHCYSMNYNQNSVISCPATLLVDINDVDISEEGLFITKPKKYGNNVDFLNTYFKFHFGKASLRQHIKNKQQINALSNEDLSLISPVFPPYLYDLNEYTDMEYEKKRILSCHKIKYRKKSVLMPFITFLNHDKNGEAYNANKKSISLSGKFDGEVFAKYNDDDVLMMAAGYEFITDTPVAYSLPVWFDTPKGIRVTIDRQPMKSVYSANKLRRPVIEKKLNNVTISWFPLNFEGAPRYPAIIAKLLADETDIPAENLLHHIVSLNLNALVPAAFQLKESENIFAKFTAATAQRQLEVIAGTRKIGER